MNNRVKAIFTRKILNSGLKEYYAWGQPVFNDGDPQSIKDESATRPEKIMLYQNDPNPFNPETTIKYSLKNSDWVIIDIYNIVGQKVENLVKEFQGPGEHSIKWNAAGYTSGVYCYQLKTETDIVQTKKFVLLK